MIPETDAMLNAAAGKLLMDIAPNMTPGYGQGSASTLAMVMILAAQEYGRAADTRAWENDRMRSILARAGLEVGEPASGFTVAELNAENSKLAQSLISLHETVEAHAAPHDAALEQEILDFLKEAAARRRLYLPSL